MVLINSVRGKFVKKGVMEPVGVCDRSGFWFNKSNLHKEYIWSGDSLVWNGLLVGGPFLDKPNEQLRAPVILDDPIPVESPRPAPYDPPGINAPANIVREDELEKVSFVTPAPIATNLHNIMGYNSANIDPKTRIEMLNSINFTEE